MTRTLFLDSLRVIFELKGGTKGLVNTSSGVNWDVRLFTHHDFWLFLDILKVIADECYLHTHTHTRFSKMEAS